MTAARWISLIVGVLISASIDFEAEGTNVWGMLRFLMAEALAAALIIAPLVLEFLERGV